MKVGIVDMKRVIKPRTSIFQQYDEYLSLHIHNVQRAWYELLRPYLVEQGMAEEELQEIDFRIDAHDASKLDSEEYQPYAEWFYGEHPDEGEAKDAFDLAWVHHQNNNEHHWQYWVLIQDTDEPKYLALDMSKPAVYEMLCDWHSFSAKDAESTAYSWYNKNKENMLLSDNTIAIIDSLIDVFKKPLNEE